MSEPGLCFLRGSGQKKSIKRGKKMSQILNRFPGNIVCEGKG